ncbi:MAG: pilin, partial [bacterium]
GDNFDDISSPKLPGHTNTPWEDLMVYVRNIIGFITIIAVVVTVVAIIWGGYLYITSAGDPSVANQGKNAVIGAVIGLIIAFAAYAIVSFIELKISGSGTSGGNGNGDENNTPVPNGDSNGNDNPVSDPE